MASSLLVSKAGCSVLAPTSSKHKFWQTLTTAKLVREQGDPFSYLNLTNHYGQSNMIEPLRFEGKPTNQLIVRDCYGALFDEIWASLQRVRSVFVIGTPGVGKTTFRNYVAWRLLQLFAGQPVAIVMAKGGVSGVNVMCSSGTDFWVEDWRNVNDLMQQKEDQNFQLGKNFFVLADISSGQVGNILTVFAGLIAFTSPDENAWKEHSKQDCVLLLMPLWKEEELLARQSTVPGVDFSKRYIKFGGVVRAVWGSLITERELTRQLHIPITSDTLKALNQKDFARTEHRFVYLKVAETKDDGGYDFRVSETNPTLEVGTRYIARLIAKSVVRDHNMDQTNSVTISERTEVVCVQPKKPKH